MKQRKASTKATRPLTDLLSVFAGPAIWFGHFSFIYGAQTLTCVGASADRRMLWIYALATIAALAGSGFLVRTEAYKTGFLPRTRLVLTLLAMLGIVWTAVPAFLLPVCNGHAAPGNLAPL